MSGKKFARPREGERVQLAEPGAAPLGRVAVQDPAGIFLRKQPSAEIKVRFEDADVAIQRPNGAAFEPGAPLVRRNGPACRIGERLVVLQIQFDEVIRVSTVRCLFERSLPNRQ
jgi:hypothetical protein